MRTKEVEKFEPKVYPIGLKLFEVKFDYGHDIGVPGAFPIEVLLGRDNFEIGNIRVERIEGAITIDEARVPAETRILTKSKKRLPKTPTLTIGIQDAPPLHYRIHKYNKIVAASYRSKITARFYGICVTTGEVNKRANKLFNEYLKAYRIVTGDPIPYVHEDQKELRVQATKYEVLSKKQQLELNDIGEALKYLRTGKPDLDGGVVYGFSTTDFDMVPKPYILAQVEKLVRYALIPDHMPIYKDALIEAIELAHRKNQYGLGVVMLEVAFEGAIAYFYIACLVLLDYEGKQLNEYLNRHQQLEDKLKSFDLLREQVVVKYGLRQFKRFRGSSEEQKWKNTTYKKRNIVLHVTNAESSEITKEDFKRALTDTQKAIALLEMPLEEVSKVREARLKDAAARKALSLAARMSGPSAILNRVITGA